MAKESVHQLNMPIGEIDGHVISYKPPTQDSFNELSQYAFPLSPDSPEYYSYGLEQRLRIEGPLIPDEGMNSLQMRKYMLGSNAVVSAGIYIDTNMRGLTGLGLQKELDGRRVVGPIADTVYETGDYREGLIDLTTATNVWLGLKLLECSGIAAPLGPKDRIAPAQKYGGLVLGEIHFRMVDMVPEESRTVVATVSPELSTADVRNLCAEVLEDKVHNFQNEITNETRLTAAVIDRARTCTQATLEERRQYFLRNLHRVDDLLTREFILPGLIAS